MKVEIDLGLVWYGERLGFAGDAQWTAVDHHLEQRLHEDVDVRGQVGDEGDVELEVFERMPLAQHLVVEMNLALVNLNVGHREALRLGRLDWRGRGCGCWAGTLEQVREIETLLGDANDMDRWAIDRHFTNHRRQPEERAPRNLDLDVA